MGRKIYSFPSLLFQDVYDGGSVYTDPKTLVEMLGVSSVAGSLPSNRYTKNKTK